LAFDSEIDYATDVFLGPVYENIRNSLRDEKMPFPEHCSKCFCLMSHIEMDDGVYARDRHIETFQIEPSMGCQLECPGCIPRPERKGRVRRTDHGQLTLDPNVLFKIVDDLHRAGVRVDKFDMQGHGEPLLNKRIWEMCGYIAEKFPKSIVSICTHANARFEPHMVHSGVNEMFFAIDGVDQGSYAPYRVHGDFEAAYRFMREFSLRAADEAPHIDRVWKYVLFSHNDSHDQLLRLQELALEAKITTLRLVATQLGNASKRIHEIADFPILDPSLNIYFDSYAIKSEQIEHALSSLRNSIWRLQFDQSKYWSEFIAYSLYRRFRTVDTVPGKYKSIIPEFRHLIAQLPADEFARFDTMVVDNIPNGTTPAPAEDVVLQWSRRNDKAVAPPRASLSTVEAARAILDNLEVDERWYLNNYPDVRASVLSGAVSSGAEHFRNWGYYEERLPYRPYVDEDFYLDTYSDVLTAYEDGAIAGALEHFIASGYREGRQPFPDAPLSMP
jgi:hypothetical protein